MLNRETEGNSNLKYTYGLFIKKITNLDLKRLLGVIQELHCNIDNVELPFSRQLRSAHVVRTTWTAKSTSWDTLDHLIDYSLAILPDSCQTSQRPPKAKPYYGITILTSRPITYYHSKTSINLMNHCELSRRVTLLNYRCGITGTHSYRDVMFIAIFHPIRLVNIVISMFIIIVRCC